MMLSCSNSTSSRSQSPTIAPKFFSLSRGRTGEAQAGTVPTQSNSVTLALVDESQLEPGAWSISDGLSNLNLRLSTMLVTFTNTDALEDTENNL